MKGDRRDPVPMGVFGELIHVYPVGFSSVHKAETAGQNHRPLWMVKKPFDKPSPDLPPEPIPLLRVELNPIPGGFLAPEVFVGCLKSHAGQAFASRKEGRRLS